MGLDISVYRKAKLDLNAKVDSDGYPLDDNRHTRVHAATLAWADENFPGRSGGLKAGVYSYEEEFGFRAGSYSGYNQWRSWLAQISGWGSAKECWEGDKKEGPFYELIQFADNEGYLGAEVAKKLAKDFADFEHAAEAQSKGGGFDPYYFEKYKEWRKACEMAADEGFISFH